MSTETTTQLDRDKAKLAKLEQQRVEAEKRANAAKEKRLAIERRIKQIEQAAAAKDRKADARMKIVIGGALLALVETGHADAKRLTYEVLRNVAERDREAVKRVIQARIEKGSQAARPSGGTPPGAAAGGSTGSGG